MDENKKTLTFCGVAVALALVAYLVTPGRIVPEAFDDQGQPFFPEFTDPNIATSLEVIDYDEQSGASIPFRVASRNNLWSIPSHHNYPADGKERLATTAAGVISIKRDDYRTRNSSEYEACGVIDPSDESVIGVSGRGQRITVKGSNERVLADLIIGNEVPGRPGFRFVRVPQEKAVYASKFDVEISTRFQDWIETDLLRVDIRRMDGVIIDDYAVNERTLSIDKKDEIRLNKSGNEWRANRMKSKQQVDSVSMQNLLKAVDELSIVGVRPKPKGLSEQLAGDISNLAMSQTDMLSLQSKGFFFSTDGQMLSNEGELRVHTDEGVIFILRFGEVLYGSGLAVTAGTEEDGEEAKGKGEARYLFVSTQVDQEQFPEPDKPSDQSFVGKADSLLTDSDRQNKASQVAWNSWQRKRTKAETTSSNLNSRFADWYYVISANSFDDLHLGRDQLVVEKESS